MDCDREVGRKVCSSVFGGIQGNGMQNGEAEQSSEESEAEDKEDEELENEEAQFHKTYCQQHRVIALIVYGLFFACNLYVTISHAIADTLNNPFLATLIINLILIFLILFSIYHIRVRWINKLSCVINIIFAIQLDLFDQARSKTYSNSQELRGLVIFGSHAILMLSSQFQFDFIGFVAGFIYHTWNIAKADNVFSVIFMWCIISLLLLQKYQHHNVMRDLFFSRQRQQQWFDVIQTVLPSAVFSLHKTNLKHQQDQLPHANQLGSIVTSKHIQHGSIDANQRNSQFKAQQLQKLIQQHSNQEQAQQFGQQLPSNIPRNSPSNRNHLSQNNSIAATSPNNRNIASNFHLIQKQQGHQFIRSITGLTEIMQGSISCAGGPSQIYSQNDPLVQWTLNLANNHSKEVYKITDISSFVHFSKRVFVDAKQLVGNTSKEPIQNDPQQQKPASPKNHNIFPFSPFKTQSPQSTHMGDQYFPGIAPPINLCGTNYIQNNQGILSSNPNKNNSIMQTNLLSINNNNLNNTQNIIQNITIPILKNTINPIGNITIINNNNNTNNINQNFQQNLNPTHNPSAEIENSDSAKKITKLQRNQQINNLFPKNFLHCLMFLCCVKRKRKITRIPAEQTKHMKSKYEIIEQTNVFGGSIENGAPNQTTLFQHLKNLFEEQNDSSVRKKQKKSFFVWKFNGKYFPDDQEGLNNSFVAGEKLSQGNSSNGIAIQVRVCGFQGSTRLVFCVDDVSVSEKIQLYQAQDKFKDLVLANTAHDLRQPLNSLNYTITEAKKILLNLQSQSSLKRSNDQSELVADSVVGFASEYGMKFKKNNPQEEFLSKPDQPSSMEFKLITPNQEFTPTKRGAASAQVIVQNGEYLDGSNGLNEIVKRQIKQESIFFKTQEITMIIELLELAEVSGNSLKYLINDILDHAKLREGKLQANFKECQLNSILEFTKHIFNHQFKEKRVIFRIILDPKIESSLKICTDQQRLQQILVNLLSNALKFTPSDKHVILHISRVSKNVNNRVISLLKITVFDEGSGMTATQLNQIFTPFVSFNDNSLNIEGIGLGLHICKSIVGLLGPYPKLFVRSKPKEGSKFFFYIYHQLRKGSQAFKGVKTKLLINDEMTSLPLSKNQGQSKYAGMIDLQEALDKKSIISLIEDSQSSVDANVFSDHFNINSKSEKYFQKQEKNKMKDNQEAQQSNFNEQETILLEEEEEKVKIEQKREIDSLEEEEENSDLDIQSIIMQAADSEDFQEQSNQQQTGNYHQTNTKQCYIGLLPHTISSLNSNKSNQQHYPSISREDPHHLAQQNSNSPKNFKPGRSPTANQSTFFNQFNANQPETKIFKSQKQFLPLLPLSSDSLNTINNNKYPNSTTNSPRGQSQSNGSLYSFGKQRPARISGEKIKQQYQQSPLGSSPSNNLIPKHYKNGLLRLNKSPKTKNSNQNPNIPAILHQFSQKYPNALNEMEASTGSAGVSMQEELSVLIADDDVFGISILKMMLKKSGLFTFDVKEVFNGKDSLLEFLKQNHPDSTKPFSLVISDIHMPQMNGIESIKKMRQAIKKEKYLPATFIGVSGIDESSQNDSELSVFDIVLTKPLKEQALLNAINQNLLDFY